MTGTDLYVNKCKQSRSYFNHLVYNSISKSEKCHIIECICDEYMSFEQDPGNWYNALCKYGNYLYHQESMSVR